MSETFDVVVLGAGPGGEVAVNTLVKAGKRVALVEMELIGGECTNWGCIPSKTLLRPAELRGQSTHAAGVATPELDWPGLSAYRDYMVSNHDDAKRIAGYEQRGVTVVKARGSIAGPGRIEAAGRTLEAGAILVATGAEAIIPPIPGLADLAYWTNREATALTAIPESVVFIGGGVVSVELSQFLARFGSSVTIVQGPPRLADREDPQISDLLERILREDGVEIVLGKRAVSVREENGEKVVELDDGGTARGREVVVATGRRPRTQGIGLETVGIEPGRRGIEVDERCRAGEGVWAIGDVTGGAFTHVAKYQARIAAMDILGKNARADYRAVPRVVFTDPELAAVGMSEADAKEAGLDVVSATVDLPTSIARPYTYEQEPRGTFNLVVDRKREVLVGAWAVAPLASEWIHTAVLAIRAEIPYAVLEDTIAQFPTFSEAYGFALRSLPEETTLMARDFCAHAMMTEEEAAG
ncbi:MAG TPA: NAD(P)/FAD-dependent oxidoreductase [Gaiellaceae bacterium]|nr:NAD(P)/FAD-dependent oxidoreductase [Gaiellaceae bacterium]